jgi:uncharacterized OsmC-like protein
MSETAGAAPVAEREPFYGTVFPRVTATFLQGEQVLVNFPQTNLLLDHPVAVGGTDMGPTPGDLLIAAVASCTAIYIGRNCRRLGIPLESVHIGVSREMAADSAPDGPLAGSGGDVVPGDIVFIPRMTKVVEVRGPLTEEHLATIKYLADHCAIGETVKRGLEIVEDVVHVTDPTALPFDGRTPRGRTAVAGGPVEDCCSGGNCEVPS